MVATIARGGMIIVAATPIGQVLMKLAPVRMMVRCILNIAPPIRSLILKSYRWWMWNGRLIVARVDRVEKRSSAKSR